jgi:hypothetical protein
VTVDDLVECARLQKLDLSVAHHGKGTTITLTRSAAAEGEGLDMHLAYEKQGEWVEAKAAVLEVLVQMDADRLPEQLGVEHGLEDLLVKLAPAYDFEYETQGGHEHRLEIESHAVAQEEYSRTTIFEGGWEKNLGKLVAAASEEIEKRTVAMEVG